VLDRFNNKGTGVGLYMVKALVEKLQGKIAGGQSGTTFEFTVRKNADLSENN